MRRLLAETVPWVRFRRTYGAAIGSRELVRQRLARLAGLIVACDALSQWCAGLLDRGFRGEMECILAKVFGSESQKEAAIEICMKTHGGRALSPRSPVWRRCARSAGSLHLRRRGRGVVLGAVQVPDQRTRTAVLRADRPRAGTAWTAAPELVQSGAPLGPAKAAVELHPLVAAAAGAFRAERAFAAPATQGLAQYAQFAAAWLGQAGSEISATLRKHQLQIPDRQCRMAEISQRLQSATVILVTSLFAARQDNEVVRLAAECACGELARRLAGRRATDRELRTLAETGAAVVAGGFPGIDEIPAGRMLMPYQESD